MGKKNSFEPQGTFTTLGLTTTTVGNITTDESIKVEGILNGGLKTSGNIFVSGSITGDISGQNITILGKVFGKVKCEGALILSSTGTLKGDIYAKNIIIEDGATLNGKCHIVKNIQVQTKNNNSSQNEIKDEPKIIKDEIKVKKSELKAKNDENNFVKEEKKIEVKTSTFKNKEVKKNKQEGDNHNTQSDNILENLYTNSNDKPKSNSSPIESESNQTMNEYIEKKSNKKEKKSFTSWFSSNKSKNIKEDDANNVVQQIFEEREKSTSN